jgi:DNA (cytosine-5)-methyltransferase 1
MEEETRIFENHAQDARYRDAGDCAPTCHSQMGTGGNNVPLVYTKTAHPQNAEESQGVCHNATVRRLLPVECERLQGFQDGHTVPCFRPEDITDELVERFVEIHYEWSKIENGDKAKRKSAKQVREWLAKISNPDTCPDAPRYKAVGNSMAVNCMEWLGRRIQMVEERIQREEKG